MEYTLCAIIIDEHVTLGTCISRKLHYAQEWSIHIQL